MVLKDEQVVFLYQTDNTIMPKPTAVVQSFSRYSVKDSVYGDGFYSVQMNLTGKKTWFQNVLQVSKYQTLIWLLELWPDQADGGQEIYRYKVDPLMANQDTQLNYDPLANNRLILLGFDTDTQTALIDIRDEKGALVYSKQHQINASIPVIPRVADVGIYGWVGGTVAAFSEFVGSYVLSSGSLGSTDIDIFTMTLPPPLTFPSLNGAVAEPTGEGSNLKLNPITKSTNSVSVGLGL